MKFNYKVDLRKSYLVAELSEMRSFSNYQIKMITKNKISGLLSCVESYGNETRTLQYDISGKKSLQHEFVDRELQYEEILNILQEICVTLTQIKTYLLDEKYLILDPEYIFYDWETGQLKFLFYPEVQDNNEKLKKLADFFIEHANHKDENVVNISYSFYKMSKESFFSLESFLENIVVTKKEYQKQENHDKEAVNKEENAVDIEEQDLFEIEKTDSDIELQRKGADIRGDGWKRSFYIAIIFLIVSVGIGIGIMYLTITYQQRIVYLTICVVCFLISVGLSIHGICLKKRKTCRKEIKKSKEQENFYEMDSTLSSADETIYFGKNGDMEQDNTLILEWEENGDSKQVPLHNLPLMVGKSKEQSQIIINHISVSRQHCKFIDKSDKLALIDMESTNGTKLNGILLESNESITIERGDEIEIGKVLCRVV